ncbi:MAG TPA: hypothetical protein DCF33_16805 [Saprospirales bacterium]|nr:hypothetical protein [Saprospirales bacterium]
MLCTLVQAQSNQASKLPARPFYVGLGLSYPFGGVAELGTYDKKGWGASFSLMSTVKSSKNKPADYEGGGLYSSKSLEDNFLFGSVRLQKVFYIGPKTHVGIEAGPCVIISRIKDNFRPNHGGWFTASHTYDVITTRSLGLSMKGRVGIVRSKSLGIDLGIISNIGSTVNYFGGELAFSFGKIRY